MNLASINNAASKAAVSNSTTSALNTTATTTANVINDDNLVISDTLRAAALQDSSQLNNHDVTLNFNNMIITQAIKTNATSATKKISNNQFQANTCDVSLSDSFASNESYRTHNLDLLSKTNLYIKNLHNDTKDQDLYKMCSRFGKISSTKAILDKTTGLCRGYGFVEFVSTQSAELAVQELTKSGIQAQMAKVSPLHYHNRNNYNLHHHLHYFQPNSHNNSKLINTTYSSNGGDSSNNNSTTSTRSSQQYYNLTNSNDADPTNLYIANLPHNMSEQELENLLSSYGPVVSTRILRDHDNISRGVGFARMESRDKCEQIIEQLNGRLYKGWNEPLLIKFADGGVKKRNHYHNYHHHHSNSPNPLHKIQHDDIRWRDNGTTDSNDLSHNDYLNQISCSNDITDLTIMSRLFTPTFVPGVAYQANLGSPLGAPQWIHPGGFNQPYVVPQQILPSAGMIGSPNQAALQYGHVSQLTHMQSLQISHPGTQAGGYLPHHQQWTHVWNHQMLPQSPIHLATTVQAQPSQYSSSYLTPLQ